MLGLPLSRRPGFTHHHWFRWGIPPCVLILVAFGVYLIGKTNLAVSVVYTAALVGIGWLTIRFDRYSAEAREIYDHYRRIRSANPSMEELDVLYRAAEWRYPEWPHDRLVELVAGKNVEDLILLMLVQENGIHPISDWHLYRHLRDSVSGIAGVDAAAMARRAR